MSNKCKQNEEYVYQAVLAKELEIDEHGHVWRIACRRGVVGGTVTIPCKCRRAESASGKYLLVRSMYNWHRYQAQASRLVYRHFHGPIPIGLTVNHEDGNHRNNDPTNLTLMTDSEQMLHATHVLGTARAANIQGEANPTSKLTELDVLAIIQRRKQGETLASIAASCGIVFQTVSAIVNKKIWRHLGMECVK